MGKKNDEVNDVMGEALETVTDAMAEDAEAKMMAAMEKKMEAMLAKAQKKADDIIENAMKKAAEIVPATTASPVESAANSDLEEYVTVRLFKDKGKYKDDVFVAVNGEGCLIQRGKPVQIKKKFALVLEQSLAQDEYAALYSEGLANEFQEKENAGLL